MFTVEHMETNQYKIHLKDGTTLLGSYYNNGAFSSALVSEDKEDVFLICPQSDAYSRIMMSKDSCRTNYPHQLPQIDWLGKQSDTSIIKQIYHLNGCRLRINASNRFFDSEYNIYWTEYEPLHLFKMPRYITCMDGHPKINNSDLYKKLLKLQYPKCPLTQEHEELLRDIGFTEDFIRYLNTKFMGCSLDISRNNIGLNRYTGEIVVFDPVISGRLEID